MDCSSECIERIPEKDQHALLMELCSSFCDQQMLNVLKQKKGLHVIRESDLQESLVKFHKTYWQKFHLRVSAFRGKRNKWTANLLPKPTRILISCRILGQKSGFYRSPIVKGVVDGLASLRQITFTVVWPLSIYIICKV